MGGNYFFFHKDRARRGIYAGQVKGEVRKKKLGGGKRFREKEAHHPHLWRRRTVLG